MMHEHGSEYQVKIVHEDKTDELGGWLNSPEQVAQAIAARRCSPAKAYWLQVRNIRCPNCPHSEPTIAEFRLTPTVAENTSFPRQTHRRPSVSAASRTVSTGA
jgi:hypothetical protein